MTFDRCPYLPLPLLLALLSVATVSPEPAALAQASAVAQASGDGQQATRTSQRTGRSGSRSWIGSYRDGLAQARRHGRPVMVVFRCVP